MRGLVFHREVSFAESDKPSLTIKADAFDAASGAAVGTLRAFEYCTKVLE